MEQDPRFPNAYSGAKKFLGAEIFTLIGSFLSMAGLTITAFVANSVLGSNEATAGRIRVVLLCFSVAFLVVSAIGTVLYIVGIVQARRDDAGFKSALIWAIASVVIFVVNFFIPDNAILTIAGSVIGLLIKYYIIKGIIRLVEKLRGFSIAQRGDTLIRLLITGNVLYCVSVFLSEIMIKSVAGFIVIIAGVLLIITYIKYLIFLAKAKKLLGKPAEE